MSARSSTLGSALACSGDMYAGVPSATPSEVMPPCAAPREANAQRLAVHERHGEVRQAVRLARGEQRHDVWMLELGRQEDLALETFERDLRRGLRREHLDHDLAVERGLLGDEHARHPTAAELALERVATAQGRLELVA